MSPRTTTMSCRAKEAMRSVMIYQSITQCVWNTIILACEQTCNYRVYMGIGQIRRPLAMRIWRETINGILCCFGGNTGK